MIRLVNKIKGLFKNETSEPIEEWYDEDFTNLDFDEDLKLQKAKRRADFNYYTIRLKEAEDNKADDLIRFYKKELKNLGNIV